MNEFLEAALYYASLGWSVIPIRPKDKKPALKWEQYQTGRASEEQIRDWWKKWPRANVGVITGGISGIIVLDVDGPEGRESIADKDLPPTTCAITGSGGYHYIFKHPGGEVRNFARRLPGLDLRGDGGYIVAPPSIHPSGGLYKWGLPPEMEQPRWAPAWLKDLLGVKSTYNDGPRVDPGKVLAGIPEGSRDTEIFKYAASLRARGMKREEAEVLVLQAAAACSPPFPQEEALAKIESAWRYPEGSEKTRSIEDAREQLASITPNNVFDTETLGALAIMKDNEPGEYAKVKQDLKGKVNLNDLERAVKKAMADNRKLHIVDPDDPPAPLDKILPDLPLKSLRTPPAWTLNENGVWQTRRLKNGDVEAICACPVPVILTERLRNIEISQEKMTLGYYRDKAWHYITTDRATIFSHTAIVQLANKGLPVNSVTAKDLVRFFADLERENLNQFPTKRAVQHLGWCSGKTFFPGAENDLILDLDDTSISVANHYHPQGDLGEWAEIVKPIREYPVARFIMAAGFASPLLEIIGQRVFIVHVWGPSRGGKTAAMKSALSIWGNPEGIMSSFNATKVGLERIAALYSDLPLGIDERQIVGNDQSKIEEIVYTLSMGKSKARGTKSGGLQAFSTWRSIIMMNGEHPLTSGSSSTGVKTRSIELYGTVIPDEDYAASLHRSLNNVFGIAGPFFIQKVIEMKDADPGKFAADYEAVYSKIREAFPDNAASHLGYVATILMGDFYSSLWIFGLDEHEAYKQIIQLGITILQQLESTADMDEATRAMNYFNSWFGVNSAHFTNAPPGGKCYGIKDDEAIWVYPSIFNDAMKEGHFNPVRILRDWAERGQIKTENPHNTCRKYDPNLGKQTRFVAVVSQEE